jgi:hypothetical protein
MNNIIGQLLFLYVLLFSIIAYPQDGKNCSGKDANGEPKMTTLYLDFQNKAFLNLNELNNLKDGCLFQLKITHINLNLYTVSIDKRDSSVGPTFKMPDFYSLPLQSITSGGKGPVRDGGSKSYKSLKNRISWLKYTLDDQLLECNKIIYESKDEFHKTDETDILNLDALSNDFKNLRDTLFYIEKDFSDLEGKDTTANTKLIKTDIDNLKISLSSENILKYMTALVYLMNNKDRTYTSLPMQFTKDKTLLKLRIKPKPDSLMLETYETEIIFPYNINDIFWGISSGIYLSFGGINDEQYSVKPIYDSAGAARKYSIVQETPYNEIGISALILFNIRCFGDWYGNFGFGSAVSITNKVRPRIMFGAGITYGEKNHFTIDFVGMLGETDVLSKQFQPNQILPADPGTVTTTRLNINMAITVGYVFF